MFKKYFTFRDRSVIVGVNEHDGQAFLRKIEFALKYRGQLFCVLLLSDSPVQYRVQLCLKLLYCQFSIVFNSPLQSVINMYRIEAPKVYQNDDITPEVSKHFGDDSRNEENIL